MLFFSLVGRLSTREAKIDKIKKIKKKRLSKREGACPPSPPLCVVLSLFLCPFESPAIPPRDHFCQIVNWRVPNPSSPRLPFKDFKSLVEIRPLLFLPSVSPVYPLKRMPLISTL